MLSLDNSSSVITRVGIKIKSCHLWNCFWLPQNKRWISLIFEFTLIFFMCDIPYICFLCLFFISLLCLLFMNLTFVLFYGSLEILQETPGGLNGSWVYYDYQWLNPLISIAKSAVKVWGTAGEGGLLGSCLWGLCLSWGMLGHLPM